LKGAEVDEFDGEVFAGHPVGAAVDDTEGTTADFFVERVESRERGREGGEGGREGWCVRRACKESKVRH
jgi:hypothetical protein